MDVVVGDIHRQCPHHRVETRWKRVGRREDGSKIDRKSFVQVMSSNVVNITVGGYHTMLLKQDGVVWTTDWNEYTWSVGRWINNRHISLHTGGHEWDKGHCYRISTQIGT